MNTNCHRHHRQMNQALKPNSIYLHIQIMNPKQVNRRQIVSVCLCMSFYIYRYTRTYSASQFNLQIRQRILRYQCLMMVKVYVHDFMLWDVFQIIFFVYVTIYKFQQVHSLSISTSMCVVRDGEYKKRVAIKRGFVAHHNLMGQ